MIKVTFEGESLMALRAEIALFLGSTPFDRPAPPPEATAAKPEKKPEPKPDAAERMAKARAAKVAKNKAPESAAQYAKEVKPQQPPPSDPRSSDEAWEAAKLAKLEDLVLEAEATGEFEPEPIDPVNLAALRVKTTEDLQAAYSNGKHKQVLALLSKYGNGAKSFRELQIQDFVPIRKAIDDGALA